MKGPKILYFVNGPAPSSAQLEEAAAIAGTVQFRNTRAIDLQNPLEDAAGVAGDIPEAYAHYPEASQAVATFKDAVKKRRQAAGDKPAPGSQAEKEEGASQPLSTAPLTGTTPGEAPKASQEANPPAATGDTPKGGAWGTA